MPIRTPEAKQLCTAAELDFFVASLAGALREATPAELKRGLARARRLRDKYRQLAEQQRREARGKQSPRGRRPSQGNERTRRKQQLFDEVLTRFDNELQRREARAAGPRKKVATARKTSAAARPAASTAPVRIAEARRLATDSELELYRQSSTRQVGRFSAAQLKSKVRRARSLRDKYRRLAESQAREARGKQPARRGAPAAGNENTQRKAQMFSEVLERFECRLTKLEAAKAVPAGK